MMDKVNFIDEYICVADYMADEAIADSESDC